MQFQDHVFFNQLLNSDIWCFVFLYYICIQIRLIFKKKEDKLAYFFNFSHYSLPLKLCNVFGWNNEFHFFLWIWIFWPFSSYGVSRLFNYPDFYFLLLRVLLNFFTQFSCKFLNFATLSFCSLWTQERAKWNLIILTWSLNEL